MPAATEPTGSDRTRPARHEARFTRRLGSIDLVARAGGFEQNRVVLPAASIVEWKKRGRAGASTYVAAVSGTPARIACTRLFAKHMESGFDAYSP